MILMLVRYTIKTTNLSAISVKTDVQVCLLFAFPGVAKLRSHAIFFHLIETIEASFIFKISSCSFVLVWLRWMIIWIGVLQIDNVIKTLYMDLKCHRQKKRALPKRSESNKERIVFVTDVSFPLHFL